MAALMVDVKAVGKDGVLRRVSKVAPIQNWRAAERLEHEIREQLLNADASLALEEQAAPLFREFTTRFLETYAKTNNKPSEVESKEMILRVHLARDRPRRGAHHPAYLSRVHRWKGRHQDCEGAQRRARAHQSQAQRQLERVHRVAHS
jgi:hypothetical protein